MNTTRQDRMKDNLDNRTAPPVLAIPPVIKPPAPAAEPVGIRCPNQSCRSRFSAIVRSYPVKNGNARMRRRKCEKCGTEWKTQEI